MAHYKPYILSYRTDPIMFSLLKQGVNQYGCEFLSNVVSIFSLHISIRPSTESSTNYILYVLHHF